jgi:hypothetical protein
MSDDAPRWLPPPDPPLPHVWHVIRDDHLMAMLKQAAEEGDARLVYIEHYANNPGEPHDA